MPGRDERPGGLESKLGNKEWEDKKKWEEVLEILDGFGMILE